jgi:outer membrane lipoprotein-sorting protein
MRFIAFSFLTLALVRAETLPDILARMDQSAAQFKAVSAKVKQQDFNAVLSDTTTSDGVIRIKKSKSGASMVIEFSEPDPRTIYVAGKVAQRFFPKASTVEIYDVSKHASRVDEFILLAFGSSGTDLKKNYNVKLEGSEMLGGVKTSHLSLVPKAKDILDLVTRIELWIPEGQTVAVQEKLNQPSKNYQLATFSDVKINPDLPDSAFTLTLPAGVKKLYPQK